MFTDSLSILARYSNHFSQLLNVYGVKDVRQTKIHTAEPLVPEPSASDVEMATEKLFFLKSYKVLIKSQQNQIKQVIEQFILRSINLILSGTRRNCLRSRRSQSLYLYIGRVIKQAVVLKNAYHFCKVRTKLYPTSCCQG